MSHYLRDLRQVTNKWQPGIWFHEVTKLALPICSNSSIHYHYIASYSQHWRTLLPPTILSSNMHKRNRNIHRKKCFGVKVATFMEYTDEESLTENNHNIPEMLTQRSVPHIAVASMRFYKTLTSKNINRLPMNVTSRYQQVHTMLWHCVTVFILC